MRALKRVSRLVTENFGWKLLSLAAAVLIWTLVATEPELSTFATARLEYKDLPEDLEISSEPVTAVSLELQGPSGELRGLGDGGQHPEVVLDMSDVTPGERTFPIGKNNVKLSRGVHIVRAVPSAVRIAFEWRLTRGVPVRVRLAGGGHNGYVVASARSDPAEVEIAGPRSHVARVDSVVTDPVDVSSLTGSAQFRVNAFAGDPFVRFTNSPQVTVTVTMKKQ